MFSMFLAAIATICLAVGLEIEWWRAILVGFGIAAASYSRRLDDIYEMLKKQEEGLNEAERLD